MKIPQAIGWIGFLLMISFTTVLGQNKLETRIETFHKQAIRELGPSDLVVWHNGYLIYAGFYLQKSNAATRIAIRSGAKWLVSATILALVDQGKLKLDDPISKFLPKFSQDLGRITLRQLLSNTSGLPSNSPFLASEKLSLKESIDSVAMYSTLTFVPGTEFSYGSLSFRVAARVAEVAYGKPWEQVFHDLIAGPCQMNQTDFGYNRYKQIGDGGFSTVMDYSRFLLMIQNKGIYENKRIISEEMIREMMTDQTSFLPVSFSPYRFKSSRGNRPYGLGVWIDRLQTEGRLATEMNSAGANGFYPIVNTCKQFVIVFAANQDINRVHPYMDELKNLMHSGISGVCADAPSHVAVSVKSPPFQLENTMPNPEAGRYTIRVQIEEESTIQLILFDPLGNVVDFIYQGNLPSGLHFFPVNTENLSAGVYFYRLRINERLETKKLIIR